MAKGESKKPVIVQVVTTTRQKETPVIPFEFKGVRIMTPLGEVLDKGTVARIAGDKLRKLKVDLSDFMSAYSKAIKKK